jgi:hypothetical protein
MVEQRRLSSFSELAAAMWPTLRSNSPEAKAKEAAQAQAKAEQRERSKRLAQDIRETREAIVKNRGGR